MEDHIRWSNDCVIVKTGHGSGETHIVLKSKNVDSQFSLLDTTNSNFPDGTKAKVVIGSLDKKNFSVISNNQKSQLNFTDSYIKEGYGKVANVFVNSSNGSVKIIVDINGLMIELDGGTNILAKVGDFVKLGSIYYCWGIYPLEIPHVGSIPKIEDTENKIKILKKLDSVKWVNKCIIVKIKKRENSGEKDVLLNCQNSGKTFSVSVKTDQKLRENQQVNVNVCTNNSANPKKVTGQNTQKEYFTRKEAAEGWAYITKAIGEVTMVFQDAIKHHGNKYNMIVADVGGLLIESIDKSPEKLKIGDFVRLGVSHVCTGLYDTNIGAKLDLD